MATPYNTHGASLELGDSTGGASSSWTAYTAVIDLTFPEREIEEFMVTTHSDSAARRIPGQVVNIGTVKGELVLDPADSTHSHSSNGIQAVFAAKATRDFRLKYPSVNNLKWTFVGFVKKLGEIKFPPDGSIRMPFELAVDGNVTIAAVS